MTFNPKRSCAFVIRTALLVAIALLASGCLDEGQIAPLPEKAPYLLADRYPELHVAVYHAEGWEPSQFALDGVEGEMLRATGRHSITMSDSQSLGTISAGDDNLWSSDELGALMNRIEPTSETTIALAFVDGGIERSDDVTPWGTALGTMALVFAEQFTNQSTVTIGGNGILPRLNRPEVERAVAIHEIGHVLGLVNRGVPRIHGELSDDDCACHSNDPESVMYKSADSDANPAFLAGSESSTISYRYAEEDIADIRAFQAQYGFVPSS